MKKKIIIAVTGGIAAYKAADVISALISMQNEVKVIATDNALNFVTSNVLNVISKGNYVTETPGETKHIELAKWCDAFVVVPATAKFKNWRENRKTVVTQPKGDIVDGEFTDIDEETEEDSE